MHVLRRSATAALCLAAVAVLAGCSSPPQADPDESVDSATSSDVVPSGTSPIVFAFVCATGDADETETYTTYSAVWQDDRSGCRAKRITGTEMSAQQRAAVTATDGAASLEELATRCASTEGVPWTAAITDDDQARVAAGLARYCPGHPAMDHLRDALAAYRG